MKRKTKKLISIISAVVLVLSMYLAPIGNTYAAASTKGDKVSLNKSQSYSGSKIDKRVKELFAEKDQVRVVVKLKESVDTAKVAKDAKAKAASQKLSNYKTELMVRSSIVNELRATANKTQAGLLDFLAKYEKSGNVKDVQSFYIVNSIAVTATKDVIEKISNFAEVEVILPVELRDRLDKVDFSVVNDAITEAIEWGLDTVNAPEAWAMGIDGTGVVVANIDTGVQWDHPALINSYRGYNAETGQVNHELNWFDAANGSSTPVDIDGHGTHTMGTMVGRTSDGVNQIGVAPGAKWIAANAFVEEGAYDDDLIEAAEWLLAPVDYNGNVHPELAPDVINNSWGNPYPGYEGFFREMVDTWRNAGIVPIFSAGNTRSTNPGGPASVSSPGNYPESIAVGATDINDNLADFSLWGPAPNDAPNAGEQKPEVSAPGVNIRSSYPGNAYARANGTSMAAPHVAGAVALILQADSSLTVDEVEQLLRSTARPMTNSNFPTAPNNGYGDGIIDVFAAVTSLTGGTGTVTGTVTTDGEDEEEPTLEHTAPESTMEKMDLALEFTVSDNIAVTSVVVEYGSGKSVNANLVEGTYKQGKFRAVIPGSDINVGTLEYAVTVTDYGGNHAYGNYSVTVNPIPSVGYFNDFETEIDGWVLQSAYSDNHVWEWGVPTTGPGSAFSGQKVLATDLDATYPANSFSFLETPPIYIPESGAYLQFTHWYNIETNWDYGYLVFTDDGGESWWIADEFTGTSGGWRTLAYNLSELAGTAVTFAFVLDTDGSINRDGWYLDDFAITDSVDLSALEYTKNRVNVGDESPKGAGSTKEFVAPKKTIKKEVKTDLVVTNELPVSGSVTVVETGISTNTNPVTGEYSLFHPTGTVTLLAEAYGYYSSTQSVTIVDGETVEANFNLEAIPQGTITGTVTHSQTGEPIAGATVLLVEDALVTPFVTGEDGTFTLTAYEGDYTLKVVAPYFYDSEVAVSVSGGSVTTQDVELDPFIGVGAEIGYDDGTDENAIAWNAAGNGFAVRMSLEEGKTSALVTSGKVKFWSQSVWPNPGGDQFQIAVYDSSGPDGAPGKLIAGPFDGVAKRNGEWSVVDLSQYGIVVTGDFYIVYIQTQPNPYTPGISIDESSPLQPGRNWEFFGGDFTEITNDYDFPGNYMIRATVEYAVDEPLLFWPYDGLVTNDENLTVEGLTEPGMPVHIFQDGEIVADTTADEDGYFTADVTLHEGENVFTAAAYNERGHTKHSESATVILDQTVPDLTITSPTEGDLFNKGNVVVEGSVSDDYLDPYVFLYNGDDIYVAEVDEDGTFSKSVVLYEGANLIIVEAWDIAGNSSYASVTVHSDTTAPVVNSEDITPTEDVELSAGETVEITYTGEEGLDVSFALRIPLTNGQLNGSEFELPMEEVEPGYYVGYFTAPDDLKVNGAEIEIIARDAAGNETRGTALGKLFINVSEDGGGDDGDNGGGDDGDNGGGDDGDNGDGNDDGDNGDGNDDGDNGDGNDDGDNGDGNDGGNDDGNNGGDNGGNPLPNTATNNANMLFIGLMFVIVSALIFFVVRRRAVI